MKIYYHDNKPDDPRLPHHDDPLEDDSRVHHRNDRRLPHQDDPHLHHQDGCRLLYRDKPRLRQNSGNFLAPSHLTALGILHDHMSLFIRDEDSKFKELVKNGNYAHHDTIIISRTALGATYDDKIATFYEEHMHEDEEVRYITSGSGYFDVRDAQDRWVRIRLEQGDLLVLPAGIYHRFTLDKAEYCIAERLFQTQTEWTALNRSEETEKNEYRLEYLRKRTEGFPKSKLPIDTPTGGSGIF